MNNDTESDNEEYVFVEFDNEMDFDEISYDRCDDEELSLTPSTSASVCSETMFGDFGSISNTSISNSNSNNANNVEISGKPRSCSIASLHDEAEMEEMPVAKQSKESHDTTSHECNTTPMDFVEDTMDEPMTIKVEEVKKEKKTRIKQQHSTNGIRKAQQDVVRDSTTSTTTSETSTVGSRLSNKKRRKKMKQLKKAAALTAFAAMKQDQPMESISTSSPPRIHSMSMRNAKQNARNHTTRRVSNNIQVICATETLIDYREGLKLELNQKKKTDGTLNFDIC